MLPSYGLLTLMVVPCAPRVVVGGPVNVTITGGADALGLNYSWTVTNQYTSPLVFIEFPHYHASLFFAPDAWQTECTYLVNVGVRDLPGTCKAWGETPHTKVARERTRRLNGKVLVRFADGTEGSVTGVELPQTESLAEKYTPLVGLALIFAAAIVLQRIRGRRRPTAPHSAVDAPKEQS
jgi:hypothetical protein